MQVLIALTVGLVFWIAAWTFGIKALDAFFVVLALVLVAVTYKLFVEPLREQFKV